MDAHLLHVNPSLPEPIYRQIADQVRRMASAGQLRPGEVLPSVREVAAVHAINPMTVSRAYSQLEAEGVLERLRGKGMAVAARGRGGSMAARMQLMEPTLRQAARHCRELELPADRVLARLRQLIEEDDA
ncbi:GntR family transcriptional regulator [Pseudoxanthomonas taiwanensis]|uniref:GntR family transcriptional regulator n=1 Tax=Pseudoxanthomonas taiwanensis TaxID=176598 RepID=A0A921P2E0_9GAMM|nr:GntR family transcriptional regulator [Pseudoxanthomonas taiwanensis]KAF1690845.1 GntR family transcriptional regulator [Pseudoxanthomonas taiwanensis]